MFTIPSWQYIYGLYYCQNTQLIEYKLLNMQCLRDYLNYTMDYFDSSSYNPHVKLQRVFGKKFNWPQKHNFWGA